MNKIFYPIIAFFAGLLCVTNSVFAQSVGIGTTTPNASARLEVKSTSQGILIPTLTSAQRSAIANPATGLLVFQTDGTPGFCYYNGAAWVNLSNSYQLNNQGLAISSRYGVTSTLAGSGANGAVDGTGTAASFDEPYRIAVDVSGNLYVADYDNNKIRKITAAGLVTTLAGSGSTGAADGTGTAASFNRPAGITIDAVGNLFVVDSYNNKIRKITPAGVVTTFAGNGSYGEVDGTGTAASFQRPTGIAIDAAGNLYVADELNNKIRKITAAGVVTTLAGSGLSGADNGAGAVATFRLPAGVAVDASGNVYVADRINHKIRKITPAGVVTTLAGSTRGSANGTGTAASFNLPIDIAVDVSGNLYVADYDNNKIRKITPAGVVSTLAGNGSRGAADGAAAATSFSSPSGVATDVLGNVYVADRYNNIIRKIIAR